MKNLRLRSGYSRWTVRPPVSNSRSRHFPNNSRKLKESWKRINAGEKPTRAALAANQRDRKKLEGDIQIHEQKISKLRDQMLQAKTNEQYRAFQSEIDWCGTEIRKSEDRILDFMEQSEPLEKKPKAAEADLKQQVEAD